MLILQKIKSSGAETYFNSLETTKKTDLLSILKQFRFKF